MGRSIPVSLPKQCIDIPYPGPHDLAEIVRVWAELSRDARCVVYTTTMAIAAREGIFDPSRGLLPRGGN
jgi:hypothetical protein